MARWNPRKAIFHRLSLTEEGHLCILWSGFVGVRRYLTDLPVVRLSTQAEPV
jgi:hypothetical protein